MVLDIQRMKEDQSQTDVASVEMIHSPFEENIKSDFSSSNVPNLTYDAPSVAPSLTARKPTDVAKRGPIHSDNAPRRCRTELPKRSSARGSTLKSRVPAATSPDDWVVAYDVGISILDTARGKTHCVS